MGGLKYIDKHIPKTLESAKQVKLYLISKKVEMQSGHIQMIDAAGSAEFEEE
ncbi:MAG: hypothetical protein IPK55_12985 [Streptococcus sp.]|nr:hypothetical protein [Streptococcus sp.]